MGTKKPIDMGPDERTEYLKSRIEDQLGDTMLIEPELKFINRETRHMKQGWYVVYQIAPYEPQRAYYLGATIGKISKAFELWLKRWKVVR